VARMCAVNEVKILEFCEDCTLEPLSIWWGVFAFFKEGGL
jgi:hypothetical protein